MKVFFLANITRFEKENREIEDFAMVCVCVCVCVCVFEE